MNFDLTEEQEMIRQAARDFAQTELKPGVIDRDEHQKFPGRTGKETGRAWFFRYDGFAGIWRQRTGCCILCLALEELAKVDASIAVIMSVNNSLVCYGLEKYGTEAQKQNTWYPCKRRKTRRFLFVGAGGWLGCYFAADNCR